MSATMSSQYEDEAKQEPMKVELHALFGIVGFAFFLVWVLFLCLPVMAPPDTTMTDLVSFRICAVLGNLAMSALAFWIWDRLYSKAGTVIMIACCVLFTPLPALCASIGTVPVLLCFVSWFLAGAASACLLLFWGSFLAYQKHRNALLYPALVALVVAWVLLSAVALPGKDLLIIVAGAPLLSLLLFILEKRYASPEKRGSVFDYLGYEGDMSPVPFKTYLIPSLIGTVASSLLLGFVLYYFLSLGSPAFLLCVFLALIVASAFRIYDSLTKERYEIKQDIKFIGLVACVGLLPLTYVEGLGGLGGGVAITALSFVMVVSFLNHLVGWTAAAEFTRVNEVPPYWNFSFGRFGNTLGLGIGYLLAYLAFGPELSSSLVTPYIPGLIVVFLLLLQAFVLKDNYSPLFTRSESFIGADGPSTDDKRGGTWTRRRLLFADAHNMSPRETELMILIVKGYSSKHIEKLLSISEHTVRAHIYNIYRKADVHSRQELIDLIEDFDIPPAQ